MSYAIQVGNKKLPDDFFSCSYPCTVEKVLFFDQIFKMEILMDLHILRFPVFKNRESTVLGSNFQNGDFDGFTHSEVPRDRKSHF